MIAQSQSLPPCSPPALRDYQHQVIADLRTAIREGHRHCLCYLPTGGGKTVVAAQITHSAVSKQKRVIFLCHRDPLVAQTTTTFEQFGIPTGIIKSGYPLHPNAPAQVCAVQTLATGNYPLPDWDLCILDECHSTTFFKFVQQLFEDSQLSRRKIMIGLTATPFRLGKQSLNEYYTTLIKGPTPKDLIRRGYLVPPRYFGFKDLDLSEVGVNRRTGDYNEKELELALNLHTLNHQLVEQYQRIALGRKAIVFAVGIDHSKAIAQAFVTAGIAAQHLDGGMSTPKRRRLYDALRTGEVQVITSVGTLTEGFDEPSLECIVLARPTLSRALYVQMVGRGLRLSPTTGKTDCIIYDFGTGNVNRFGRITDHQPIVLQPKKYRESDQEAPLKQCPNCSALIRLWHQSCPECGYVYESILEEVPIEDVIELLNEEELKQRSFLHQQYQLAFDRGYKPGYAVMRFKEQYNYFPAAWWSFGAVFGNCPTGVQKAHYRKYLKEIAQRHGHDDGWIDRYMGLEFGHGFLPTLSLSEVIDTD
ncbi:MAG: DEAD/DEAH box helicase family protein [Leptolyngbyaceae cyanobacterium bins.302]|nr:DEAD/DEAH box helicase family protein [Leptolyngbyaceae cyanobacterium bins.302]